MIRWNSPSYSLKSASVSQPKGEERPRETRRPQDRESHMQPRAYSWAGQHFGENQMFSV